MRSPRGIDAEKDVAFERVSDVLGRVAIPLPFFSVPVNVWILRAERPLLVDAGPRTDDARARVEAGLAAMATRPEELGHVFVTHHHVDHSGLLHEWIARSSAMALAHRDDFDATMDVRHATTRRVAGYREVARRWGMTTAMIDAVERDVASYEQFGGTTPPERGRRIAGEREDLAIPGARLVAIHTPGHTEGQTLLWDEERHALFAGDHILERVTPNPNVYVPLYRGRATGLGDYVRSLESLRALPQDTLVLPGHGAGFRRLHARIDEILEHHARRRDDVLARLEPAPRTIIEIALALWERLRPRDMALAAREVHGHLDMLEESGRVARDEDASGAWRFRRLA